MFGEDIRFIKRHTLSVNIAGDIIALDPDKGCWRQFFFCIREDPWIADERHFLGDPEENKTDERGRNTSIQTRLLTKEAVDSAALIISATNYNQANPSTGNQYSMSTRVKSFFTDQAQSHQLPQEIQDLFQEQKRVPPSIDSTDSSPQESMDEARQSIVEILATDPTIDSSIDPEDICQHSTQEIWDAMKRVVLREGSNLSTNNKHFALDIMLNEIRIQNLRFYLQTIEYIFDVKTLQLLQFSDRSPLLDRKNITLFIPVVGEPESVFDQPLIVPAGRKSRSPGELKQGLQAYLIAPADTDYIAVSLPANQFIVISENHSFPRDEEEELKGESDIKRQASVNIIPFSLLDEHQTIDPKHIYCYVANTKNSDITINPNFKWLLLESNRGCLPSLT